MPTETPLLFRPSGSARDAAARFHDPIRARLPDLVALAEKVEAHHADDPDCPVGIGMALADLWVETEEGMREIEGDVTACGCVHRGDPATRLERQRLRLEALQALTHGYQAPVQACGSWRRLYAGVESVAAEIDAYHRWLETGAPRSR